MTFNRYRAYPFVRFLVPFAAGLLIAIKFSIPHSLVFWFTIALIAFVVFLSVNLKFRYSHRWINGLVIHAFLFIAGLVSFPNYQYSQDIYSNEKRYDCKVVSVSKNTEEKQTLVLICSRETEKMTFKILAYVNKNRLAESFCPGDKLIYNGAINKVEGASNPYTFDYSVYLSNRDIIGQIYLTENNFRKEGDSFNLLKYFFKIRLWAESKFKALNLENEEFGILSALILGDKSYLNYQTKASFSNAGVIHILSVSGLHVGIIYLILISLFCRFNKPVFKIAKIIMVLCGLWFYAGLSGMSPSVLRSTTMFSVFIIGQGLKYQYNIYHSMAISAFIILLFDPYAIIHAGFWLSYFAVASIVYFYPLINNSLYFSAPYLKYFWSLISVSIAAQIGTAPLVIYLFGFFPTWFLVANVFIIPILPFLLLAGIIAVVFPVGSIPFVFVSGFIFEILHFIIQLTMWISDLPYAQFISLQFDFPELGFFYASLLIWIIWKGNRQARYFIMSQMAFLLFLCVLVIKVYHNFNQQHLVVHQTKRHSNYSYIKDGTLVNFMCDSVSKKEFNQSVFPLYLVYGCQEIHQQLFVDKILEPIVIKDHVGIIVNGNVPVKEMRIVSEYIKMIIITSQVPFDTIEELVCMYSDMIIVFDSSFSRFQSEKLRTKFEKKRYTCYYTSLNGAYIYP